MNLARVVPVSGDGGQEGSTLWARYKGIIPGIAYQCAMNGMRFGAFPTVTGVSIAGHEIDRRLGVICVVYGVFGR